VEVKEMKNIDKKDIFLGCSKLTLWIILGIFVVFAFFSLLSINSDAATINVPDDYPTIQQAIDNATNGDIVFVFNGTYYENITVNKSIQIIGEDKNNTIIDSGIKSNTIFINADWVTIENFTIYNNASIFDFFTSNIYLCSNNNTICNNIIFNLYPGTIRCLVMKNSSYNTIINNTFKNIELGYGIEANYDSHNNNIIKNSIYTNYSSIHLQGCSNNIINNTLTNSLTLSYVYDISYDNFVSNNTFIGNKAGINIRSINNTIIYNNFTQRGIYITGDSTDSSDQLNFFNTHIIKNNFINGKPIYYYKNNHTGGTIPFDTGQIILANCSNFTIEKINISYGNYGIELGFCNNCTITECNISGSNMFGIYLYGSSYNTISDCTVFNNQEHGIGVNTDSCHNLILNCTAKYNVYFGIHLLINKNNIVKNCISNENGNGLLLHGCAPTTVFSSDFDNNNLYGIFIGGGIDGNHLFNINVKNNARGIVIKESDRNRINNSIISDNNYGIWIDTGFPSPAISESNLIHDNIICNNWNGITMRYFCHTTRIAYNNISNNSGKGIFIDFYPTVTYIHNNILNHNGNGIKMYRNSITFIEHNILNNNSNGISAESSYRTRIGRNEICNNTDNGIIMQDSTIQDIEENLICHNINHGLHLSLCTGITTMELD
jgi:parallel beta-helix repeat protein